MITFRYHIVSLVSVFLALAIGIALGGGPLKGEVDSSLVKELAQQKRTVKAQRADLAQARARERFTADVLTGASRRLLGGNLQDVPVAVVLLPGSSRAVVSTIEESVDTAGGSMAGVYRVGRKAVDPEQRGLVEQLTTQLADEARGLELPRDGTAYERAGALVGRAVAADVGDQGADTDRTSRSILSGLATADLVTTDTRPRQRGAVVLVLTGASHAEDAVAAGAELAAGMAGETEALVVAGPRASATEGGLIREIRDDVALSDAMSTVDNVGSVVGGVVTVLTAQHALEEGPGHYGSTQAPDGALPGAGTG